MLRATLDTNTFVSSLLVKAGLPAQALDAWRQRRYVLATSPAIISEVRAVLGYPRIRRKYAIRDDDVDQLVALLEKNALVVAGEADVAGSVPDDPADEAVIACAVEANADVIVSGDHHLLNLESYRDIPIITVRKFMDRVSDME